MATLKHMRTKNSIIIMSLIAVLTLMFVAGGTYAYLLDSASSMDTMTVGNVKIEQMEQERNGNGGLRAFTQDKVMEPAKYAGSSLEYNDTITVNGKEYNAYSLSTGAVDKIVSVHNTGKSEAYVRTLVAYEDTEGVSEKLHFSSPEGLVKTGAKIKSNGTVYSIAVCTYSESLKPGRKTAPSMLQWYLDKNTDQSDIDKMGATYDIICLSQAVQAGGFSDAGTALDSAFGEITSGNAARWFTAIAPFVSAD